ncbi:MAG: hypothetical protein ABH822_00845 [Patescibacteria group bacterium]
MKFNIKISTKKRPIWEVPLIIALLVVLVGTTATWEDRPAVTRAQTPPSPPSAAITQAQDEFASYMAAIHIINSGFETTKIRVGMVIGRETNWKALMVQNQSSIGFLGSCLYCVTNAIRYCRNNGTTSTPAQEISNANQRINNLRGLFNGPSGKMYLAEKELKKPINQTNWLMVVDAIETANNMVTSVNAVDICTDYVAMEDQAIMTGASVVFTVATAILMPLSGAVAARIVGGSATAVAPTSAGLMASVKAGALSGAVLSGGSSIINNVSDAEFGKQSWLNASLNIAADSTIGLAVGAGLGGGFHFGTMGMKKLVIWLAVRMRANPNITPAQVKGLVVRANRAQEIRGTAAKLKSQIDGMETSNNAQKAKLVREWTELARQAGTKANQNNCIRDKKLSSILRRMKIKEAELADLQLAIDSGFGGNEPFRRSTARAALAGMEAQYQAILGEINTAFPPPAP